MLCTQHHRFKTNYNYLCFTQTLCFASNAFLKVKCACLTMIRSGLTPFVNNLQSHSGMWSYIKKSFAKPKSDVQKLVLNGETNLDFANRINKE